MEDFIQNTLDWTRNVVNQDNSAWSDLDAALIARNVQDMTGSWEAAMWVWNALDNAANLAGQ